MPPPLPYVRADDRDRADRAADALLTRAETEASQRKRGKVVGTLLNLLIGVGAFVVGSVLIGIVLVFDPRRRFEAPAQQVAEALGLSPSWPLWLTVVLGVAAASPWLHIAFFEWLKRRPVPPGSGLRIEADDDGLRLEGRHTRHDLAWAAVKEWQSDGRVIALRLLQPPLTLGLSYDALGETQATRWIALLSRHAEAADTPPSAPGFEVLPIDDLDGGREDA